MNTRIQIAYSIGDLVDGLFAKVALSHTIVHQDDTTSAIVSASLLRAEFGPHDADWWVCLLAESNARHRHVPVLRHKLSLPAQTL